MKRVSLVLSLCAAAALAAIACDPPKKPPMTPDNDMFDAGVDMTELGASPASTVAPDGGHH